MQTFKELNRILYIMYNVIYNVTVTKNVTVQRTF